MDKIQNLEQLAKAQEQNANITGLNKFRHRGFILLLIHQWSQEVSLYLELQLLYDC